MVKIRALVRDPNHVDQGIEVARSLADAKLFGRIFEQTRLTPDGLPELGPFFLGNPHVTPSLQYAFLGMLDGLCEGASVDASLHRPTKLHLRKWRMPRWPDRLERLDRVRLLRLDKCWFDELPGFVRDLVALREIHATQCELRSMTLDNPLLEHVDARSNHLRTLPSIQSARLRVLDVRDNGIETLEGLERHTGLRRLRMRSSRVLRVGDGLGGLPDLELLELSRCGLKTLPEQLAGLGCLEHLDLRENLLESLPDSLADVQALRALDLTQNRLSHLPSTFARAGVLPELRKLRLGQNPLLTTVDELAPMTSLRFLDLSRTALASLPVHQWTQLRILDISHTEVDHVDLGLLPRLEELKMVGAPTKLVGARREGLIVDR
jgi:hypothetical protein